MRHLQGVERVLIVGAAALWIAGLVIGVVTSADVVVFALGLVVGGLVCAGFWMQARRLRRAAP